MAEEPTNTTGRYYVDCGIQTDVQNRHIASPNSRHSLTSCSSPLSTNSRPTSRTSEISNKVPSNISPLQRPIVLDSSPTNKEALSTRAMSSNIRSSQHSSSYYKHSDLLYARPSGLRTSETRVISLPEASSVFRVKAKGTMRVFSMPDCIHSSFSRSSPSMDRSYIELSGSTGNTESNFDDSFVQHHRFKSSNLPQTPSPPSSPESVMIINHSANVPRSFLSKKQASYDAYTDEDGWITWANSPPRPIPALHGPSSLPYARCPSGAEGTIIEGEDLSRMIWGLDSSQSDTSKVKPKPAITHRPIPQTNTPTLYHTSQLNNTVFRDSQQDIIDISSCNVHRKHEAPIPLGSSLSSTLHSTPKDYFTYMTPECGLRQRDISQSEVQGRAIYSEMVKPHITNEQPRANEGLGLNLDWNNVFSESRVGSGLHPNSRSSKATTTSFSASHDASDKINSFNQVKHQNQSRTVYPSRGMSALGIAHQYHTKKLLQNNLLTPPDSCSPQWSPFLPTLPEYPQLASPDLNQQQLLQYIHSQLLRTSSISGEFQQNHPQRLESHLNDVPTSVIERDLRSAVQTMQKLELASNANSDVNAYRPLSSSNRYQTYPLSPVSPRLQSTIIRQAPRSIPLARLVQRRLSSESEEPVIAHRNYHYSQPLTTSCTQHERDSRMQTARLSMSKRASRDVNSAAHGTRDASNLYHRMNAEPAKRKPAVINEKQSANNDIWSVEREDVARRFATSKKQKESELGDRTSRRRKSRNKHKKSSASQPIA